MVNYEQARQKVLSLVQRGWSGPGELVTGAEGYEDSTHFAVPVGAREWIEGDDPRFSRPGDPIYLVNKNTGAVEVIPELENQRVADMVPVVSA